MTFVVARRALAAVAVSLAAAALVPGAALAHGPVRQKLSKKIEIDAPAAKVWAIVGNFQDIGWLPAVAKTEGSGDNTPDVAKRKLTLKNGGEIEESLNKYDAAGMTLAYRIDKVDVKVLPVTNYAANITVTPNGDKSTVEWKAAYYRGYMNNDPPPELNEDAANNAVGAIFDAGLAALKAKAEGK